MIIWLFCSLFSILFSLNIANDFINRLAQFVLPGNNVFDLSVKFFNINYFAGVFLRHIGGHRDVVVVFAYGFIADQFGEMVGILARGKRLQYPGTVLFSKLVFVSSANKLGRSVNKQYFIVLLAFFKHDNAGS